MKIFNFASRADWLEWRKTGIGASDAPAIMGVSPWKTITQLWEEKTGFSKKKQSTSPAMQHGIDTEPIARANYELLMGCLDMSPLNACHDTYDFLKASYDGHNGEWAVEIKCPTSPKDHIAAKSGRVPDKYFPQVQHQMMVDPLLKRVDYFSYMGSKDFVKIEVLPDPEYIRVLMFRSIKFWGLVTRKIRPDEEEFFK